MTTPAFTLAAARCSYVHIPRRDLVLSGGDDLIFKVALVEADRPDADKIELRGTATALYLTIWHCSPSWDYSAWRLLTDRVNVLASVQGVPDLGVVGLCRFTLPRGALADQGRRLSYSIAYDDDGVQSDLCWGRLHVWPSIAMPPVSTSGILLNDDYTPILDDAFSPIEV